MIRNKSGLWGEIFAAKYLRDRGYEVLLSNYVCRFGEIDIIAQKKDTVCFVEVKSRNQKTDIRPMEAVDSLKIQRIEMAAKYFISASKLQCNFRFDVCEVYLDDNNKLAGINYMKNAF